MKRIPGFTLIELLIVMAVLAILLSIALLPNFKGMQDEARMTRAQGDLRMIRTALEAYCKNHDFRYPAEVGYQASLIAAVPQIMPSFLYDPFGATNTTQYIYQLSTHDPSTSKFYLIYSVGHKGTGIAAVDAVGNVTSTGEAIFTSNGN
jgi:prepilin-type N-terminal cleavage/methylation domain-containing protein